MFDFFNDKQNPFAAMMDMCGDPEAAEENDPSGFGFPFMPGMPGMDPSGFGFPFMPGNPMQFMQQGMMMQMQFMQMCMMPFQMMSGLTGMMKTGFGGGEAAGDGQQEGFKLGNITVPPEMLQMLMNIDMSPENLEKLQKVLDFVFEMIPDSKEE